MKDIEKLKALVESKGGKTLDLDNSGILLRLGYNLEEMRRNGYDPSIIEEHQIFNNRFDRFISHPSFGDYLRYLTPEETYTASGMVIYPLSIIKGSVAEGSSGGFVFPFGYLPLAGSDGGNELFFHADSGSLFWADQESFSTVWVTYRNQANREWESCDFSEENVPKAMVLIANDFESFLTDFLNDKRKAQFDGLN